MQSTPMVRQVLFDEALTRGLGDVEARMLVEWLVDWAEMLADLATDEDHTWEQFGRMCRRARVFSRFVALWSEPQSRGAATQLAAVEKLEWALPSQPLEPDELMERILDRESRAMCN
jgi:hypothetical protein